MANIIELSSQATGLVSSAWRAGDESVDFTPFELVRERDPELPAIDLDAVREVVRHAMEEYADRPEGGADAWLAPRLHSALRVTRREAARLGLWRHLGLVVLPEYVRHRWGPAEGVGDPAAPDRFHGPTYKHALGRLWWGAELFRDGPDYTPVEKAFQNQDLMNNFFRMDVAHHRPTAQAAVKVLFPEDAPKRGGREANALSKAVNAAATTLLVDAMAVDAPLDTAARHAWMQERIDPLLIIERMPTGPDDPRVPERSVTAMTDLLEVLFSEAPVRGKQPATDGAAAAE